jgi:hypothetical protein
MALPPRVVGACQSDEGAQRSAATTRVAPPPLGNHTSANVAWDGGRASGEVERRLHMADEDIGRISAMQQKGAKGALHPFFA